MSPLDAARRLVAQDVVDLDCSCQFCAETVAPNNSEECFRVHEHTSHAPDCPWLAMPQILAVLEAAERLMAPQEDEPAMEVKPGLWYYTFCAGPKGQHFKDCAWQALVAALKGEVVPSHLVK